MVSRGLQRGNQYTGHKKTGLDMNRIDNGVYCFTCLQDQLSLV